MEEFVTVCRRGEIPPGGGKTVEAGGKLIAVFDDAGTLCAISDVCPHMGASLSDGELEDGVVTCRWHAWRFRVADGTWMNNPRIKIPAYEVRQVGDEVQVRLAGGS
ncbi:MAG: Rieske 2Fe-2S domain-containing protein [Gemmataceae bacterium]|nr:Rieske 2Fe-2S domain-containing protein [Gemmataceae bacterium]